MLQPGEQPDFLRKQILTARNIAPSRWTDFFYGGLNYQIEHHLFPSMPRNHLQKARPIVRRLCQAHRIQYAEAGLLAAYCDMLRYLEGISFHVRRRGYRWN